jgi:hypothetical protein
MTGGGEGVRRAGEELAFTFRQLRERAVTFGHPDLGRIARRAGAAVRAALEGPRWRLQTMGVEIGDTLTALRAYLQAESDEERRKALERAEVTLQAVAQPAEERIVDIESLLYSPQDALVRAKELSQRADGMLKVGDADADVVRATLQEALDLVEQALDKSGLPE